MREREISQFYAVDSVADAMMVALFKQIGFELRHAKQGQSDQEMREMIRQATSSGCRLGSAYALWHLWERHRTDFSKLLMVETHSEKGPWAWHDYFLVKGVDGVWYAGSPANYGRGPVERTTNIVRGRDLSRVMTTLEEIEDNPWPPAEDIIELISDMNTDIEVVSKSGCVMMRYFCVSNKAGCVGGEWCSIRL